MGNQFHQFSGPGFNTTHLEVGACQAKAHSHQCRSSGFPTSLESSDNVTDGEKLRNKNILGQNCPSR